MSCLHSIRMKRVETNIFKMKYTKENIKTVQDNKATKGNLIMIAENWAPDRSTIKNTSVAQWNDWFREDIKNFVVKFSANFGQ